MGEVSVSGSVDTGEFSLTTTEVIASALEIPFPWSRRDVDAACPEKGGDWVWRIAEATRGLERTAGYGMLPPKKRNSPMRPYISPSDYFPERDCPFFYEETLRTEGAFDRAKHSLLCLLLQLPAIAIPDPMMSLMEGSLYSPLDDLAFGDMRLPIRRWLNFVADYGALIAEGRLVLVPETGSMHDLVFFKDLPDWRDVGRETIESFACDGRGGTKGMKLKKRGPGYLQIAAGNVSESLDAVASYRERVDIYLPHPIHWHVVAPALRELGISAGLPAPMVDLPYVPPSILEPRLIRDLHADEEGFAVWRNGLVAATAQMRDAPDYLTQEETRELSRHIFREHLMPAVEHLAGAARRTGASRLALSSAVPLGLSLAGGWPSVDGILEVMSPVRTWIAGRRLRRQARAAADLYRLLVG